MKYVLSKELWIENWKLWTKNLDISTSLSLNEYLFFEIGFEQRPVNWNCLDISQCIWNDNFSLKFALNNELWIEIYRIKTYISFNMLGIITSIWNVF